MLKLRLHVWLNTALFWVNWLSECIWTKINSLIQHTQVSYLLELQYPLLFVYPHIKLKVSFLPKFLSNVDQFKNITNRQSHVHKRKRMKYSLLLLILYQNLCMKSERDWEEMRVGSWQHKFIIYDVIWSDRISFVVIIVWRRAYTCTIVMLKGTALRRIMMSLFETGWDPMTVFMVSLWTRTPLPCSCLSSFPLKKTLCSSAVIVSPKFFHLISQSPRVFHLYLSILCVSSWSFPAAFSVLVFHVPMVMLSLPQIFDDAPVAYLTSILAYGRRHGPCWPGRRPTWYGMVACFHHMVSHRQNTIWRSPSLQVEHVAVEFIMELFHPSGPFLWPMKISAQWCHVDTCYFTLNLETRGGQEHLIPSHTSPKDLPTAPKREP